MKGSLNFLGSAIAIALLSLTAFCAEYENVRTFEAGEIIATAGLRVKLSGVTVVKAGSGEDDIGSVTAPCIAHEPVGVKLARTGTSTMIADGVIAAGTVVYPAASGKVSASVVGSRIGTLLTAAAADGSQVEVLRVPFTLSVAGDLTVGADKNVTATAGSGSVTFGDMTGTFVTPSGAGTLSGTTNIAANKNLTCSAGSTAVDLHLGSGTFKTSYGAVSLYGTTTLVADKGLLCAAGIGYLDMSLGTGICSLPTGATTINGNTTLVTGKTMALTDADALTVGGKIVPVYKTITCYIPAIATKTIYDIFIADRAYTVTRIDEVNDVDAGTALTMTVVKATSTNAPVAATTPMAAAIDVHTTAYTVQTPTLTSTTADLDLAAGNRIGIVLSAASTTGTYVVTITMKLK